MRIIILALSFILLTACATTDNQKPHHPYMGTEPGQNAPGNNLYDANQTVQQPQTSAWGWFNNH